MPLKQGFTLIEILVVIVIIGITLGFAVLAFGDFGASRHLITSAEQFTHHVKLIQQQAMLESATYGIQIEPTGYSILRFAPPKTWQTPPSPALARRIHFPAHAWVSFTNTGQKKPSIILYATGDMTPFRLSLGLDKQPHIIDVVGLQNGTLSLERTT